MIGHVYNQLPVFLTLLKAGQELDIHIEKYILMLFYKKTKSIEF